MSELVAKIVGHLLTPPGLVLSVAILGYLLRIRWPRFGSLVIGLGLASLYVLSVPFTGRQLLAGLETPYAPLPPLTPETAAKQADAIVILGGGRYPDAPEYGGDTVNQYTLERLRYGAYLARETKLPVLVSGGALFGEKTPEAELMAAALGHDFGIKPRWLEGKSATTYENARYSAQILHAAGIRRVFLVTHAWHMRRAVWSFTMFGVNVVPAPLGFATLSAAERGPLDLLPSAHGLTLSALAFHERIGLMWYRSREDTKNAVGGIAPQPAPAKD